MRSRICLYIVFNLTVVLGFAQNNPNAIADTLNSRVQQVEKNLNKAVITIQEKINPLVKPLDSVPAYDSLHGKIIIIIKNLKSTKGNVNIALYNSYSEFAKRAKPFRGAIVPLNGLTCTVVFDSIPKGVYSMAAFHDEDKNGILASNQLNIPTEGFCFSNNIGASLVPPDYNRIKFVYSGKNKTMVLLMTYFKFP